MNALRATVLVCAALFAAAVIPQSATAYYGAGQTDDGAELVSADYERLEQGDDSTSFAVVSGDGRFVVMQTRARNFFADDDPDPNGQFRAGGLFRYEAATRDLTKVADGDLFDEDTNAFLSRGASNPSVSEDGRYVAFATAQRLVPADLNGNVDVYVRDMEITEDLPGAFDLVSARDGSDIGASYGQPPVSTPGTDPGAELTRGAAISADGRQVVFRTVVASDLPSSASVDTPERQVFVRDRQTNATTLVTRTDPGGAPAGGAFGASISADGTTVGWTGDNAPAQTRFLNGESTLSNLTYYLWQRVADGPAAPTRRITGVADPDDPACPPDAVTNFDQTTQGPCFGPLTDQEALPSSLTGQVPALSADGYTVAYLTGGAPRPLTSSGTALDLFVADMHPGVTRKAGTTELTRGNASNEPATGAPIAGLAMSPDGGHLVITTVRTTFTLPALTATGASRAVAGTRELYAVDLAERTIDRVARSYVGEDINGDIQVGATISNGGERIAFTSFAGNLLFGDANGRPDAFLAKLQEDPEPEPEPPTGPPAPPTIEEERLIVRTKSQGRGATLLMVQVPAAGGLKVVAQGRAGKPRSRRSLATGTGRAAAAGWIEVPLRIVERYRGELRERGQISASARLDFVYSVGGGRIKDTAGIVFRQKAGKGKKRGGK